MTIALAAAIVAGVHLGRSESDHGTPGQAHAAVWVDLTGNAPAFRRVPEQTNLPDADSHAALVDAIIGDLQDYWSVTLPTVSGEQFTKLRGGVIAVDSAAPSGHTDCVAAPANISGNAYYCPSSDGIVYDSAVLLPVLLSRYGIAGVVATFAHEFGHAVQSRIGPTPQQRVADPDRYPSLVVELQGDCDAGAYLASIESGEKSSIHFGHRSLIQAVGPLLDFADSEDISATDPTAHGWAVDRLRAVVAGYRDGAMTCANMTLDSIGAAMGSQPSPTGTEQPIERFAATDALVQAAAKSIDEFTGDAPEIVIDEHDIDNAARYGQFAQAARYAQQVGRARYADDQGSACFVGAWTGSIYGHVDNSALGGWPGDVDEALASVRHHTNATFATLTAFVDGFDDGLARCDDQGRSESPPSVQERSK